VERLALKADTAEPVEICPNIAAGISPPHIAAAPQRGAAAPTKLVRRWLALNRGRLRAVALGALALLAFLLAWHLLTKYRVNIYVRFLNVPSPEQVLDVPRVRSRIRNSSPMWS
jgi:NitT/TauT family transport system permease protein